MELDELRKKIDVVDVKLLELLDKRASLVKQVGRLKSKTGRDFYVPHREKKIITGLLERYKGHLPPEAVESIFREIVHSCRSLETRLKVAYFGPEATFTHQAALKNFGSAVDYIPVKLISDVFTEVEKNRADYGVVPIENSTEGIVNHTLDMFMESDLVICAEISLPIEHCLLALSEDIKDIKKIYSHYQPLGQCRNWIEENLPGIPIEETSSTSEAARKASKEKGTAAIASKAAAVLYNLEVVVRGIEDSRENYTRFLAVGRNNPQRSGQDKTSIMVSLKDKVGALHELWFPLRNTR